MHWVARAHQWTFRMITQRACEAGQVCTLEIWKATTKHMCSFSDHLHIRVDRTYHQHNIQFRLLPAFLIVPIMMSTHEHDLWIPWFRVSYECTLFLYAAWCSVATLQLLLQPLSLSNSSKGDKMLCTDYILAKTIDVRSKRKQATNQDK